MNTSLRFRRNCENLALCNHRNNRSILGSWILSASILKAAANADYKK